MVGTTLDLNGGPTFISYKLQNKNYDDFNNILRMSDTLTIC